ncbi:lipase [Melampsora larici-populina 98AG31]|uniref:Carboxylic ester hydrolase n=1 Tax=Melampsora larici-populina (strain 98AG31 / pathotype 3-4-7) TaxID=747676 RepID=F4RYR8_MELLP|nr:lipase [Melampsora larici-populina 98AG31]EGG02518.1 lipase [Melampsora larici-populina 98AG31]
MHINYFNFILLLAFKVNAISLPRNIPTELYQTVKISTSNLDSPIVQNQNVHNHTKRDLPFFDPFVGANGNDGTTTSTNQDTNGNLPKTSPNVALDYGNFIGGSLGNIESFTGIPFAEPPVGLRRLTNPIPPLNHYSNFDATKLPPACPQALPLTGNGLVENLLTEAELINQFTPLIGPVGVGQEDCLTLDVRRPKGIQKGANVPVMVYIYGGAFEFGATNVYDGSSLVSTSISQKTPIIYVAMNYRLNGFGFLGGKEVGQEGVGNLGLKDQRLALKWVQKYIGEFGGDPSMVTIFGESAGAISVSQQLTIMNGNHEGLFRAAICESGTASPIESFAEGGGQKDYDTVVSRSGCQGTPNTLECLRQLDFDTLYRAVSSIDGPAKVDGLPFRWIPRIDGDFITDTMKGSISKGAYARVPLISGNQDDEGTILTAGLLPLFSNGPLRDYLASTFFQKATSQEIDEVLRLYPQDPSVGSPYNTGFLNILTPIFKQVASMYGDIQFQAPRRQFLEGTQASMPVWSYIDKGFKLVPYLGAFHGTDVVNVLGILSGSRTVEYQSRWISFANTMNPNVAGYPDWPNYGQDRQMLEIGPNGSKGTIIDDFRQEAIQYINDHDSDLALRPL